MNLGLNKNARIKLFGYLFIYSFGILLYSSGWYWTRELSLGPGKKECVTAGGSCVLIVLQGLDAKG